MRVIKHQQSFRKMRHSELAAQIRKLRRRALRHLNILQIAEEVQLERTGHDKADPA